MSSFVTVSRPDVGWSELSLAQPTTAALRRVAEEARRRAANPPDEPSRGEAARPRGFAVLFTGPSGTGKTLAAEVLASDLGRALHHIDLSGVVSKYIGETEKNLREVFDAAESADVVLMFDEADALFGKRSEVKDGHDRFANTETNFLLQRVARYAGLVILVDEGVAELDHPGIISRFERIVDFAACREAE